MGAAAGDEQGQNTRQFFFVNNSHEGWTSTSSGAIATHISATRAAAARDGHRPVVLTRAPDGPRLDDGPTRDLRVVPRPPGLLGRALDKLARRRGWQSWQNLVYARRVDAVVRREARPGATVVLHNDPDIADWLAARHNLLCVAHVFHNLLPHGRSSSRQVQHLAVSRWLAGALVDRGAVAAPPELLPNGVDATAYRPRAESSEDPLTVSFLGRTGREKGLDVLQAALLALEPDRVRGLRLLVIGSNTWGALVQDDYQSHLQAQQAELAARGVVVERTGHVGREAVPEKLRSSTVHVVPSRWEDPAPLVLMEALASGLAVVAARSGGMPEYGEDSCRWFDREDVLGLAAQLDELIGDPAIRADLATRARRRAEGLSWDRTWTVLRSTFDMDGSISHWRGE